MNKLTFVSRVNGLQVTAPRDAYPAPNCDGVMCEERPVAEPEEPEEGGA